MSERLVYCPGCNHKVRLVLTEAHVEGQANLPEGAQMVCLDFGEGCSEGACPLTGRPGVVMGMRLAKSHLNDEAFRIIHGECGSCGALVELEMLDGEHAVCPRCEATNTYLIVDLDEGEAIAVTGV